MTSYMDEEKGIVVYDAKYELRVMAKDVIKLLAYITEYAYPITMDDRKILSGAIYKLAPDPRHSKTVYPPVKRNSTLPMEIAVHIYIVDPRMPKDKIDTTIEQSLQPLLNKPRKHG